VVAKQHTDGLASDLLDNAPMARLQSDKSCRPALSPLRGRAANHRDDRCLLALAEHLPGLRALLLGKGMIDSSVQKAPSNAAYRSRVGTESSRNLRDRLLLVQKRESSETDPHLPAVTACQLQRAKLMPVASLQPNPWKRTSP
jgi:hypothetical protein